MNRVLLLRNDQKRLCLAVKNKLGLTWKELSIYLKVNRRAFQNWYLCKRLFPENIFNELNSLSGLNVKPIKILSNNWGQIKGGKTNINKNGRYFGTKEGRIKAGLKSKESAVKYKLPFYSKKLAELIGIMLGDGGISKSQISVTLGFSTDFDYVPFVRKLIEDVLGAKTSFYVYSVKNAVRIRSSGVNIVKNLNTLGLITGNKIVQQIDIPEWIKIKKIYIKACLRGLIDTDGCVHRKVRKSKDGGEYRSIGITFSSYSRPLQTSVVELFNRIGLHVSISGPTIFLCGQEQVKKYVHEIGFTNPKHYKRYLSFLDNYGWKKVNNLNCITSRPAI